MTRRKKGKIRIAQKENEPNANLLAFYLIQHARQSSASAIPGTSERHVEKRHAGKEREKKSRPYSSMIGGRKIPDKMETKHTSRPPIRFFKWKHIFWPLFPLWWVNS